MNWFGITDVNEILDGPDRKTYAVAWIGAQPDPHEVAKHVSPMTYVRPGLPPIITIQGDHDPTVPYSQGVSLRDALTKAGVQINWSQFRVASTVTSQTIKQSTPSIKSGNFWMQMFR